MTTRLEYLKLCVNHLAPLESKTWYIMAIGIPTKNTPYSPDAQYTHLDLFKQDDGMYYLDNTLTPPQLVRIVDAKKDTALFCVQDRITVDSTWLPSIGDTPIEVSIGGLIVNTVAINPSVGKVIPYMAGEIKVDKLESAVAVVTKDEGPDFDPTRHVTVAQYLDCMDRLWFFTKIANLVTMASSERTTTAPPGSDKLRKQLLQENKDRLSDPVVVAEIVQKLTDVDTEYLKDDPVAARMFDKKARTARKKLYLMYGETNDFVTSLDSSPITSTMSQGVDTSDENLPKYMNDLRYASFSRGHSTQLSGYSYKILQRSLSGVEITNDDCNTNKGVLLNVDKPSELVGRYIRLSSKWVLVQTDAQAAEYKGKYVEARSPMYCKTRDFKLCYRCMGESFKDGKNAMNNLAADFSGTLMGMFLKRMHTSGFSLTKIDVKDLVT